MGYLSEKIRESIKKRANFRCEYCKIHQDDLFLSFEIDHIIAQKHGGGDELENLAYSCPHCNQHKGSDLVTFLNDYNNLVRLFNPRIDIWEEHFEVDLGAIIAKTEIAEGTIKILQMNQFDLIILRDLLQQANRYPK